jgi:hypothetical protein
MPTEGFNASSHHRTTNLSSDWYKELKVLLITMGKSKDRVPRKRMCYSDKTKQERKEKRDQEKAKAIREKNRAAIQQANKWFRPGAATNASEPEDEGDDLSDNMLDSRKPSAEDTASDDDSATFVKDFDDPWEDDLSDSDDSEYDPDEDSDDDGEGDDPFSEFEREESVMGVFLEAVYKRIQKELSSGPEAALMEKWLMSHLKRNQYWIRQSDAEAFCSEHKLDLKFTESAYYRDILVWLPEIRWGHEGTPYCPCCRTNTWVKFHSYRSNHFGRVVIKSAGHYFVISRRYRCNHCKEVTEQAVKRAALITATVGGTIEVVDSPNKVQYNFMGYNPTSVEMLPYGWGNHFPAFFTHRGAVDKSVIDLMRPLFNYGVRPLQLHKILLEQSTKKHHRQWIAREYDIKLKRKTDPTYKKNNYFSQFKDPTQYAGKVPSAKYLSHVYKKYGKTILSHFDREVKKRGARRLHWDASFKEAKQLCRYRGKPVFRALVTGTNELGEVRIQFHVVTDGHDQMCNALKSFLNSVDAYGQIPPELVFTDKPSDDKTFFLENIPSIAITQSKLDEKVAAPILVQPVAKCLIDDSKNEYRYTSILAEINEQVDAIHDMLNMAAQSERVVAWDCEWVYGSKIMYPPHGRDRVAVAQIGHVNTSNPDSNKIRALVMHVHTIRKTPQAIRSLFEDEHIIFVGRKVKEDLDIFATSFPDCRDLVDAIIGAKRYVDLADLAFRRGVGRDRRTGLKSLVFECLREDMSKENMVRSGDWRPKRLSDAQKVYAALDIIKGLEVYLHLIEKADLTARITSKDAVAGTSVNIVPPHGKAINNQSMTLRAGVGQICEGEAWEPPSEKCLHRTKTRRKDPRRVVTVAKVSAANLIVPGIWFKPIDGSKRKAILGDFGTVPFKVELPLTMLQPMVETIDSQATTTATIPVADIEMHGTQPTTAGAVLTDIQQTIAELTTNSRWSVVDGPEEQNRSDSELRAELDADEIAAVNELLVICDASRMIPEGPDVKLSPAPVEIIDKYQACLGDNFHYQQRPRVPVRHEIKKQYYVSLTNAFFVWSEEHLEKAKEALRTQEKMTDEQIQLKMFYDLDYFLKCVPRKIPAPSLLYWRVRGVFATYGPMIDSTSKKPLFNDTAWKKADGVLKEILAGHVSDPPGFSFYTQKIGKNGKPNTNKHGLPIYSCNRGTNLTETYHKQLLNQIGTWCTGTEMADTLRAEHRHRYNHFTSERKRAGFPRIGHVDTWLIDCLQILHEENHIKILFPFHSNTSDYLDTEESFDTIALQSTELTNAVNALELPKTFKMTPEQQYLAKQQGVIICFTPLATKEEKQLFVRLLMSQPGAFDENAMALSWVVHVNGSSIFPKDAVYLRTHHEEWSRNRRREDAVKAASGKTNALVRLNERLRPRQQQCIPVADTESSEGNHDSSPFDAEWIEPGEPPFLQPAVEIAPRGPHYVGGMQIGNGNPQSEQPRQYSRGERGPDRHRRAPRRCARCVQYFGSNAAVCIGRSRLGAGACQYFPPASSM